MTPGARRPPFRLRLLGALLSRLWRLGIRIRPLVETREGVTPVAVNAADLAPFTFAALSTADLDALVALGTESNREQMLQWFGAGKLCFGLRDGSKLVANSWCDLDEVNFAPVQRKLASDEAYMFAAYTDPTYRGHDLAPRLRRASYAALHALGCKRLCSYSEYLNAASRRFKQKLGAVEERLCVHIDLFGAWSRTITLRRYVKKREVDL